MCSHLDSSDSDVLASGHLVAHEVLKDDADFRVQIGQVVFAEVNAIKKNAAFARIVETCDQLDDGGLALAVLADQRDALSGAKGEIEVIENVPVGARISEGDIAELESARHGTRRTQTIRL